MVNAVRGKLREERIAAISTQDLLTTEIIDLINDAGSEILEGNDWEFDVRHDGKLWFPASQSGTDAGVNATTIIDDSASAWLFYSADSATGKVFDDAAAIDLAGFRCSGNRLSARVVLTSLAFGNTSWIITEVNHAATALVLTLSTGLKMDQVAAGSDTWTTYANELVLPATVKDVLSVRNEEEPIRLEFINRDMQFDRCVPRATDSYSNVPEVIYIGGTVTSTIRSSTTVWDSISNVAAVTGTGCMVWPIPSADITLEYSYRVQHSDLSAATDTWTGVPDHIIHTIELRAFQSALESGIQNDPDLAGRIERQVEKRTVRALMKQSRQPNLRRVPPAFGSQGHSHNTRRRWASQTIAAP